MHQPQHHDPAASSQRPSTSARTAPTVTSRPVARRSRPAQQVLPPRRPTTEQIARRAYERYLARGCVDGYALEDWACAERELTQGRL